jgi:serine/threonine protein kinase
MDKTTRDALETTRTLEAASSPSRSARRAGDVLAGKYLLLRPLGAGGMGQVWVARNLATHAEVAAKVLLPERVVYGDALDRFRDEAQATASLSHRGIVRAFDLVELDSQSGSLLLVMELLHGQTLARRLDQAGRLTVAETARVLVPILLALDHAHRVGIIHRDLKPDNIFLAADPDGEMIPKLVDFGISKMRHASRSITARGALVGTPFYMSPEQARAEPVDGRSDVFAVGILLYECLSGAAPFDGDTLHDVVRAVLEVLPPPLAHIPPELQRVMDRALSKRADERFATAAEFADAILAAVPDVSATLRPTPAPPPASLTSVPPAVSRTTTGPPPPRSRGPRLAWVAILGCLLALGFGTFRLTTGERPGVATSASAAARSPHAAKRVAGNTDVMTPSSSPSSSSLPPPPSPGEGEPRGRSSHPARSRPAPSPPAAPTPETPPPATVMHDPGF